MTEQQQQKNKRIAALSSVSLHVAMLLLMFFIVAWIPPDPPLGANGVSLNIGLDLEGSGDYQPETVGDGGSSDQPAKTELEVPPPQEAKEQPIEEDVKDTKSEVETGDAKAEMESPIEAKEPKKEKSEPKKTPVKETPPVKAPEPVKEQPKVDQKAVFDPNAKKTLTDKTGDGKAGEKANQGDDVGKTGDKGDPRGVKEGTVYEGNPGKGGPGPGGDGGFGLTMSGWTWDSKPNAPKLEDNENGFVVFEITVDDQGDIVSIDVVEKTLSPEAIRRCRQKIEERSFVRTAGGSIPPMSKGKVRFDLRVK